MAVDKDGAASLLAVAAQSLVAAGVWLTVHHGPDPAPPSGSPAGRGSSSATSLPAAR